MSQFAALVVELAAKLGQAVPSAKVDAVGGGFWGFLAGKAMELAVGIVHCHLFDCWRVSANTNPLLWVYTGVYHLSGRYTT